MGDTNGRKLSLNPRTTYTISIGAIVSGVAGLALIFYGQLNSVHKHHTDQLAEQQRAIDGKANKSEAADRWHRTDQREYEEAQRRLEDAKINGLSKRLDRLERQIDKAP